MAVEALGDDVKKAIFQALEVFEGTILQPAAEWVQKLLNALVDSWVCAADIIAYAIVFDDSYQKMLQQVQGLKTGSEKSKNNVISLINDVLVPKLAQCLGDAKRVADDYKSWLDETESLGIDLWHLVETLYKTITNIYQKWETITGDMNEMIQQLKTITPDKVAVVIGIELKTADDEWKKILAEVEKVELPEKCRVS